MCIRDRLQGPAAAHRADIPAGVNITKVMLNFLQRRPSGGARFSPTQRPPPATPLFSHRHRREKTRVNGGRESPPKKEKTGSPLPLRYNVILCYDVIYTVSTPLSLTSA